MLGIVLNIKKIEINFFFKGIYGYFSRDLYMNFIYMKFENGIKYYVM